MKIAGVILVTLVLAIAPIAARGDDAWDGSIPAKARTLAERGRAFHDAGDYPHAIAAFTQAYVIAPSPALLFNLAQAYRLEGNCDDAALMYRRYLATNPGSDQRALAEAHLASVERCLHKIALHIPTETASSAAITVPAPQPRLTAIDAPPVSRRAQIEKDIGVGLAIGGGVSLAVAAYYAMQAHDASNDVAAAYAKGGKWQQIAPLDDRGQSAATKAKLFGAGGALGLAGGIVTYLIGRRDEGPPVTVATTQHGFEVGVRWKY
jgi:tetratricopeptide (TPR) repeat protein